MNHIIAFIAAIIFSNHVVASGDSATRSPTVAYCAYYMSITADQAITTPYANVIRIVQGTSEKLTLWQAAQRLPLSLAWAGYRTALATSIPMRSFSMSVYGLNREEQGEITAAAFAGFLDGIGSTPSELRSTRAVFRQPLETGYLRHTKGMLATIARATSTTVIMFPGGRYITECEDLPASIRNPSVAGFISGCASQLVGYPIEVIKTRAMATPAGAVSYLKIINEIRNAPDPLRTIWRGFLPRCLRIGVTTSIITTAYPVALRHINDAYDYLS